MFANNSREDKVLWLSTALCLIFIANQYLWLQNNTYVSSLMIGFSILAVLLLSIKSAKGNPGIAFVLLISCFLAIITLGTPTTAWDARSVWLFHAKRIYLDNNLLAQLDNYAAFSHNDYPVLLPALSATMAKITGQWNEVFPKTSNLLFILPPLLAIASAFRSFKFTLLFVTGLFLITGRLLTNGFMDGILALYVAAMLVLLSTLFLGWRTDHHISSKSLTAAAMAHTAVLVGIKNEGTMAAFIMLFCLIMTLAVSRQRIHLPKILLIFLPGLMMSGLWLLFCHLHGVGNDIATNGSFTDTFTARITDITSLGWITLYLYGQKWLLFLPLVMWLTYVYQKQKSVDSASFLLRFGLAYSLSLFLIYLGSPHDLQWHLSTSANRTMLPVLLTFMTCFLMLLAEKRPAVTGTSDSAT